MTRWLVTLLLCLLPTGAAAQTPAPPTLNLELSLYAFLQASDVATTHVALRRGAYEANHLMRWADTVPEMVLVKAAVVGLTTLVVKGAIREGRGKEAKVILWVTNGLMAAVLVNNLYHLRHQRR